MADDRPCRAIFGRNYGDQLHDFIEAQRAAPCHGDMCPLLDRDGHSPLLPVPDTPSAVAV